MRVAVVDSVPVHEGLQDSDTGADSGADAAGADADDVVEAGALALPDTFSDEAEVWVALGGALTDNDASTVHHWQANYSAWK